MGHALRRPVEFKTITCGSCAMVFAVPTSFHTQCLDDGRSFRCPNVSCQWDSQSYTETATGNLKKELAKQKRRTEWAEKSRDRAQERAEHHQHRANGYKGQMVKQKKRAAKGVCPCCNRSFVNVARHMASKHPEYGQ